jgi:hypothetical protein
VNTMYFETLSVYSIPSDVISIWLVLWRLTSCEERRSRLSRISSIDCATAWRILNLFCFHFCRGGQPSVLCTIFIRSIIIVQRTDGRSIDPLSRIKVNPLCWAWWCIGTSV